MPPLGIDSFSLLDLTMIMRSFCQTVKRFLDKSSQESWAVGLGLCRALHCENQDDLTKAISDYRPAAAGASGAYGIGPIEVITLYASSLVANGPWTMTPGSVGFVSTILK